VLGVTVQGSTVTIDLSRQFNDLKSMGETTESFAQRALRKSLSKYGNLEKMRVTVDGKPFDSEATDWNTPFPIRGEGSPDSAATGEGARGARPDQGETR
jgi:hypothetical protein